MKQGTKRIIAREGLIIISLAIVAITMHYLRDCQHFKEYEYLMWPKTYVEIQNKDILVYFPKGTNENIIQEAIKRDFKVEEIPPSWLVQKKKKGAYSDLLEASNHSDYYDETIEIPYDRDGIPIEKKLFYNLPFNRLFIFSIFLYPAYWLVRFVLWAAKTLRINE